MRAMLCAVGVAFAACACSWQTLGVYKLDINQGNYVTQDQVDRLKVCDQRFTGGRLGGTPLLADPFHAARWDYVYMFERQAKVLEQRRLTVYFVDDKIARWEGDEMPPPPAEVARAGGGDAAIDKSLSTAPKTREENWLLELLKKLGWWD